MYLLGDLMAALKRREKTREIANCAGDGTIKHTHTARVSKVSSEHNSRRRGSTIEAVCVGKGHTERYTQSLCYMHYGTHHPTEVVA